jgi:hypothetical protein
LGCANDLLSLFHRAPYEISSLLFFGPYCLLIGYLIFMSTFLPRILGVLMAFAGVGWLLFLSPLVNHLSTYLKVLGFVAEMSLMLWLIVKGVNVQRWEDQAIATRMHTKTMPSSSETPNKEELRMRRNALLRAIRLLVVLNFFPPSFLRSRVSRSPWRCSPPFECHTRTGFAACISARIRHN